MVIFRVYVYLPEGIAAFRIQVLHSDNLGEEITARRAKRATIEGESGVQLGYISLQSTYSSYIWVNYNDLTVLPHWNHG